MSETTAAIGPAEAAGGDTAVTAAGRDSTDIPIPLWPEGVLAVLAGVTLLVIGLRHRTYIQRKVTEAQSALDEFQRQGGLDDIRQVTLQASEFLKGSGS